jgi:hypothetical protein
MTSAEPTKHDTHPRQGSKAVLTPTKYGERMIAQAQFEKGCAFIASAILLRQRATTEAHQWVSLHLLCQGIEVSLKGVLLLKDYGKYRPLERKLFGHKLVPLVETALKEFEQRELGPQLKAELKLAARFYFSNELRYAGHSDILIAPSSLPYDRLMRRTAAFVRLVSRRLKHIAEP